MGREFDKERGGEGEEDAKMKKTKKRIKIKIKIYSRKIEVEFGGDRSFGEKDEVEREREGG